MSASVANRLSQARRTWSASPWLRARVWLRRGALDRKLASGAEGTASRELALRAAQLAGPHARRRLAAGLERVLDDAERPTRGLTAAVPLQRREILAARAEILALAREVVEAEPVGVHGLALVAGMLSDGDSPLYALHAEGALDRALNRAGAALLPR